MNVLPFRRSQSVNTDSMADIEAASSIPPWPVDFGPRAPADEPPHLDEGVEMLGRLFIYAICVVAAVSTVAAVWPA